MVDLKAVDVQPAVVRLGMGVHRDWRQGTHGSAPAQERRLVRASPSSVSTRSTCTGRSSASMRSIPGAMSSSRSNFTKIDPTERSLA